MCSPGLRAVADCGAWYASLRRTALADVLHNTLGAHTYRRDGLDVVFAAVENPQHTLRIPVSSVATISADADRVRWSWADTDEHRPADLRCRELRNAGDRLGLTELRVPELSELRRPSAHATTALDSLTATLGALAVQLVGDGPYLSLPLRDGGCEVVVTHTRTQPTENDSTPIVPEPTLADLAAALPDLIAESACGRIDSVDHRAALHGLATRLGWQLRWQTSNTIDLTTEPTSHRRLICIVGDHSTQLTLSFDHHGRATIGPYPVSA